MKTEYFEKKNGVLVKAEFPSYKKLQKKARKAERQKRIDNFFDNLCCKLGIHDWVVKKRLACNVPVGNTFTGRFSGSYEGETIFEQCSHCPTVRCIVSTGNITQQFPIGQTARSAIRHEPKLGNDPFMIECSQL